MSIKEDDSLELITPAPEHKLHDWLAELYGKPVAIERRELLRHRDLSRVERLHIADGLPASLIYKQVLPPWDVEQDLHERVLIPSVSNSAQLYLTGQWGQLTALFLEDLGTFSLLANPTAELAARLGKDLAKMHRAYCYRTDELMSTHVLRALLPIDYGDFTAQMSSELNSWGLISADHSDDLSRLGTALARKLAGEPTSLVHGDFYAENIIMRNNRLFIIDWSWFTILGVPIMDLATIAMVHKKNGGLSQFREELLEAYCFESGREVDHLKTLLPFAETLARLLFLNWLVERRSRGILGTTVGPVDHLIPRVVEELRERLATMP